MKERRAHESSGAGVPRGIEVLLKKARIDPEFRERLRKDPVEAAGSIGLVLFPAERAILAAVPREDLLAMADRVEVPEAHRHVFLGRVAAAMLALAAGTSMLGCGGAPSPPPPGALSGPNEPIGWNRPVAIAGVAYTPAGKMRGDWTPTDWGAKEEE